MDSVVFTLQCSFFLQDNPWSEKAQNGAVAATLVQQYICQLPYDDDDDDDDDDDGVDDGDDVEDDDDDEWRSGGCRLPMQQYIRQLPPVCCPTELHFPLSYIFN